MPRLRPPPDGLEPGASGGGGAEGVVLAAASMGGLESGTSVGGLRASAAMSWPKRRGIGAGDAASLCVGESV